jgi:hypothetical protein
VSDPTYGANRKRNALICKLADEKRLSYSVIAEMIGVSRNVVAGVVFRHHHPIETRSAAAGHPAYDRNMMGTGWRPSSYYPEKTAINSR